MRFLSWVMGGRGEASDAEVVAEARESLHATAPVHVLRDEGLVQLVDGHLCVSDSDGCRELVRFDEISQVSFFGNAGITTPCLRELLKRGIPVVWRSTGGYYLGQTADMSGHPTAAKRGQYRVREDPIASLCIARVLIEAKITSSRSLLRRHGALSSRDARSLKRLAAQASAVPNLAALRGIEGAAAATSFSAWPTLVHPEQAAEFAWQGRQRQPSPDRLNALLSYLYAVAAGECAVALLAAGLDPSVGFLHAERAGRPALALDLLEPLRPAVADSVAIAAVNRREVRPEHFTEASGGMRLNDQGRRAVLAVLERRWADVVPGSSSRGSPTTWRDATSRQARLLASCSALASRSRGTRGCELDLRLYLVCYDIACPRRWRRVHKTLRRRGAWQQYSMFLCRLSSVTMADLEADIASHMDLSEDRLMIVDLGSGPSAQERLRLAGRAQPLPLARPRIF